MYFMGKFNNFLSILIVFICVIVVIILVSAIINPKLPEDEQINIIVIDSCEYISSPVYCGFVLTHKGNCKNHE